MDRREFCTASLTLAALQLSNDVLAHNARPRLEWQQFVKTSQDPVYVKAVAKMRANKNSDDENSWFYWANIHENYCPHETSYFLAWHRGYLALFEDKLRQLCGVSDFMLPYWDYYKYPALPAEFTNHANGNPLYVPRACNNVVRALSLGAFGESIRSFEFGLSFSFEAFIELMPHNRIHNIVGGVMGDMQSPQDPIFWLHHANIDRLLMCWQGMGNGRRLPDMKSTYWDGDFTYASNKSIPRSKTADSAMLNYTYNDLAVPRLPGMAGRSALPAPQIPSAGSPKRIRMNATTGTERLTIQSNGKPVALSLDEHSSVIEISVDKSARDLIDSSLHQNATNFNVAPRSNVASAGKNSSETSLHIILDEVSLTELGKNGGYFYEIYLNVPGREKRVDEKHFIGGIGPFEINTAIHASRHHASHMHSTGVTIRLAATHVLKTIPKAELGNLSVLFLRVSGEGAPKGAMIKINNFSIRASTADRE